MIDLLQKTFAPFSLRGLRGTRPGHPDEWTATVCVNGAAVAKLQVAPDPDQETTEHKLLVLDLDFIQPTHEQHFREHTQALMRVGVLPEQSLESAMTDLVTLMADAYLGDKTIFRLAKEGTLIYRLTSDPLNAYRRAPTQYTSDIGAALRHQHGAALEWVVNELLEQQHSQPPRLVAIAGGRLH